MQKCRLTSFFGTSTTTLHHTLWLGQTVPESNISHRCAWTSSTNGGGICLNHSLNGVSMVTLITCSIEWVQPSSQDSKKKCHGTQQGVNKQSLPALVAKMPGCSNLTSQTAFPVFALWPSSVSGYLGPHPMHPLCPILGHLQCGCLSLRAWPPFLSTIPSFQFKGTSAFILASHGQLQMKWSWLSQW